MSKRVVLIDGSRGVHVSTCRWMVYSFIVADGMLSPRPPAMVLHTSTSTMAGPAGAMLVVGVPCAALVVFPLEVEWKSSSMRLQRRKM